VVSLRLLGRAVSNLLARRPIKVERTSGLKSLIEWRYSLDRERNDRSEGSQAAPAKASESAQPNPPPTYWGA
jgi:hypothetical protein